MNRYALASLSAALLLTACGPAQPPADTRLQRQPGSWTMIHYTMAYDAKGLSGDMAEMVKAAQAMVGKKEIGEPVCLSAERVAKDDLAKRLAEAIQLGPEWKTTRSAVKDGNVYFEATMNDPAQGSGKMTITGTLSPTTTDLIQTNNGTLLAPQKGQIHTVIKTENRRVGDCTPGQMTLD
jgi:Protein of unknown function (DUF3617)